MAPNARFSTPVARYSTTRPTPESAYTPPNASPITMKGLRNSHSTPNMLKARRLGHRSSFGGALVVIPSVFLRYFVFRLNFFSQTRVWASSLSTGAMSKHFSFSTTLPFL